MKDTDLMTMALGLNAPWMVTKCEFDVRGRGLDIHIDFRRGAKFNCPDCGATDCAVHDTIIKKWRHLNFFEHFTHLHARTPRVTCKKCGVRQVTVPWARPGSGFTLLFEAFVMALAPEMSVMGIAAQVAEWDTRLWRVIDHWVARAREAQDFSKVKHVGVDETASRRGHNYISVFVDMDRRAAIYATEGKDHTTVERFVEDLEDHDGQAENITEISCDMSPAFAKGVEKTMSKSKLTFDKFHVVKIVNKAVDEVRRAEQKERPELKGSRYAWIKNAANRTEKQKRIFTALSLPKHNFRTARAHGLRVAFQELYDQPREDAEEYLRQWLGWAARSRLKPMIRAGRTIRRHMAGILRWFESGFNNAILEGFNSLIQMAKSRARGYRNIKNLITMVYLIAGRLEFERLYPQ